MEKKDRIKQNKRDWRWREHNYCFKQNGQSKTRDSDIWAKTWRN